MTATDSERKYTMVIIGDSFVRGTGAADRHGWSQMLADDMDEIYNVHINGHGGHNIQDILDRMDTDVIDLEPDIVLLQVGINDSRYRDSFDTDHEVPPAEFKDGLAQFVELIRAEAYPHTQIIIVGTTPVDEDLTRPYKPDKQYVNSESKKYDDIIKNVCRENYVRYIDVFSHFADRDVEDLLDDGVHPNNEGHKLIYEVVSKNLSKNRGI